MVTQNCVISVYTELFNECFYLCTLLYFIVHSCMQNLDGTSLCPGSSFRP